MLSILQFARSLDDDAAAFTREFVANAAALRGTGPDRLDYVLTIRSLLLRALRGGETDDARRNAWSSLYRIVRRTADGATVPPNDPDAYRYVLAFLRENADLS